MELGSAPQPRPEALPPSWYQWRRSTWTTSPACSHPAPLLALLSCPFSSSSYSSPSPHQPGGLARSRVLPIALRPGHSLSPRPSKDSPLHSIYFWEALDSVKLLGATSVRGAGPCFVGGGYHSLGRVMTCQSEPWAEALLALSGFAPSASLEECAGPEHPGAGEWLGP